MSSVAGVNSRNMWISSPNSQKALFGIVLALLVATGIASYIMAERFAKREERVIHTYQVLSLLNDTALKLDAAENARRGYILTGDRTLLIDYDVSVRMLPENLNRLQLLTADNPEQQQRITQLRPLLETRLNLFQQSLDLQERGVSSPQQQAEFTLQGIAQDDKIRPILAAMQNGENLLLRTRSRVSERSRGRFTNILVATFLLAAMILGALFLVVTAEAVRRTRAEAAAKENEEKFRLLVSGIQDYAIIRLDLEGRITTWNRGAERLFGYNSLEILGEPLTHLFQSCDHDTPQRHLRTALQDGNIQDECQQVRKDGTVFWVAANLTLLRNGAGQPRGYALITRDITERRRQREEIEQREAQLDAFFSNAPVGLAIIDKDLRFQRINGPFSSLNGLQPETNTGLTVRDVTANLPRSWSLSSGRSPTQVFLFSIMKSKGMRRPVPRRLDGGSSRSFPSQEKTESSPRLEQLCRT